MLSKTDEMRIERVVLKHHRDVAVGRLDVVRPRDRRSRSRPTSSALEPGEQPEQRRLAAAGRPEQHEALAGVRRRDRCRRAPCARRTASIRLSNRTRIAAQLYSATDDAHSDGARGTSSASARTRWTSSTSSRAIRSRSARSRRCGSASGRCCAAARRRRRCARARSLGLRAKYVGVTGTDENGRRIRAELHRRDIDHHRPDHPRRAEPVRGDPRRRDHRRSHRAVGSRRASCSCASASCRSRRSRARASCTSTMSTRGGDPGGGDRARGRRAGDERHRSADRPRTEELVGAVTHADLRRARADARSPAPTTWRRRCARCASRIDNVLCVTMGEQRRDGARRRSASITSRRSGCRPSTRPAPATCSAPASSMRSCDG